MSIGHLFLPLCNIDSILLGEHKSMIIQIKEKPPKDLEIEID